MYWAERRRHGACSRRSTSTSTRSTRRRESRSPTFGDERPHRSARGSRPRSRDAVGPPDDARRHLQGSADRRRPRVGGTARPRPATSAPTTSRTGALRWTLPHDPASRRGRLRDVVEGRRGRVSGGANNWAGMALDERARHRLRADRIGRRRLLRRAPRSATTSTRTPCSRSNAATGKRLWHFQSVRHDIWDRDPPSPPNLVTRRAATADRSTPSRRSTKHGYVFVFDRTNGTPLFPIEYRKFPPSDVPGEVAAETQPIPTKPAPFARQSLTTRPAHERGRRRRANGRSSELRDVPERRAVRAARRRRGRRSSSRASTAARSGAGRHSIPRPASST